MKNIKNKLSVIKEKILIVIALFKTDQYAFFSLSKAYENGDKTAPIACYISDNASKLFIGAMDEFNKKEIDKCEK